MAARTFELSAAAPESAASGDGAADAEPAADSKAFSPVRDLPDVIINGDRGSALLPAALALETAAAASAASSTQATEELMLSEVATSEAVEVSVEAEGKAARTLNKEKMGL